MEGGNLFVYIIISVLLMLVFALGLVWFFVFSSKKLALAKIKEQHLLIDFKQKLLTNTLETQEKEKRKIAMELHDDVSSLLNLTLLTIRQHRAETNNPALKNLENMLYNCSEKVRSISHELTPLQMKQFNIKETVQELVANVKKISPINTEINNLESINFDQDINKVHLFRIIQELINNALKHSNANSIKIDFSKTTSGLEMSYTDDGIGLNANTINEGIGMTNMQSRVAVLNGSFEIQYNKAEGLQIKFKFND